MPNPTPVKATPATPLLRAAIPQVLQGAMAGQEEGMATQGHQMADMQLPGGMRAMPHITPQILGEMTGADRRIRVISADRSRSCVLCTDVQTLCCKQLAWG